MSLEVEETGLPGVKLIRPKVHEDGRGRFLETWNEARYRQAGIPARFVQDNVSYSGARVLRGLHLQHPHAQGKLVHVLVGRVWDVAIDLREDSPTFRQWTGVELTAERAEQLWIPPGFGHGFCVLSEHTIFAYKCTDAYEPSCEFGIAWNDPDLGIRWPIQAPIVSDKDRALPRLRDLEAGRLPRLRDYDDRPA